MDMLIGGLVVAAGYAVLLGLFAAMATRMRRRGIGGALMGPIDEIYHPNAFRYRAEVRAFEQRAVPIPSPGDRPHRRATGEVASQGAAG